MNAPLLKRILFSLGLITLLSVPTASFAFSFNFLLSDSELVDGDAMSVSRIQRFLTDKGGALARYTQTVAGVIKTAAQIIAEVGGRYNISPKFILATLQKEQSLVQDPDPTARQYDYAMGFACPDGSGCDPARKGFFNQVNLAAKRIREGYLADLQSRGYTISGWGPGITKIIDGQAVTPENDATAVLYTYTPHINGNVNFHNIWLRYFPGANYPNGSLLQADTGGGVYLISAGKKRPFASLSVFLSKYNTKDIIQVSRNVLDAYDDGAPIKFADFTFIRSPKGTVCMIKGDKKFCVSSQETLRQIGINPEEIEAVGWRDYNAYPEGAQISTNNLFPTGALIQRTDTGGVYYVENGIKHPIWSREILQSQYPRKRIIKQSAAELNAYTNGDPLKFKDGTLATSPGTKTVYFISDGKRRPITSKSTFENLGLRWDKIVRTSDAALNIHALGEPLRVEN